MPQHSRIPAAAIDAVLGVQLDVTLAKEDAYDILHAAIPHLLPGTRWGVLAPIGDEIHAVASAAQAAVLAWTWRDEHPDPAFTVHRVDGGDWTDECGLTYTTAGSVPGPVRDGMADVITAASWLWSAAEMVAETPSRAWVLDALRSEARAHGHVLAGLED